VPAPTPISLKGRALRYLAAREHSRAELERKLRGPDTDSGELARTLDDLEAKGFISAERVAESVLHRRSSRFGTARIRRELQDKGLDIETVQHAVERLQATEVERARDVWRRKFGEPALDAAGRAKQMRFLAARGFGTDTIRRVVSGAGEDDE
jgi:regulatory protein